MCTTDQNHGQHLNWCEENLFTETVMIIIQNWNYLSMCLKIRKNIRRKNIACYFLWDRVHYLDENISQSWVGPSINSRHCVHAMRRMSHKPLKLFKLRFRFQLACHNEWINNLKNSVCVCVLLNQNAKPLLVRAAFNTWFSAQARLLMFPGLPQNIWMCLDVSIDILKYLQVRLRWQVMVR